MTSKCHHTQYTYNKFSTNLCNYTLYSSSQKYLDTYHIKFFAYCFHYSAKEILKRVEQRICFNTYIYAYIRIVLYLSK